MSRVKWAYKGKFIHMDQLPKADLPEGAVPFDEPSDLGELAKAALPYLFGTAIPVLAISAVVMILRLEGERGQFLGWPMVVGSISAFLTILPHELLHGLCFGPGAEVEMYSDLKKGIFFVVCTRPITKGRFIFLSLFPNLVFGWIPWLLWLVLPIDPRLSSVLWSFSLICITFGAGDYMNVANALRQMPKGSMQVLSGFNSFWFRP